MTHPKTSEGHTDYDALIERLEKATGPDRVIDEAVHRIIDAEAFEKQLGDVIPHYTESVSDAIRLVPKGWTFGINDAFFSGTDKAKAAVRRRSERADLLYAENSTPAIALCIAALRARATGAK